MSAAASTDAQPAVTRIPEPRSPLRAFGNRRPAPTEEARAPWWRRHALLLSILLTGFVTRLWLIWGQLPTMYHPDEPFNLQQIERMVHSGDLNPHFFN